MISYPYYFMPGNVYSFFYIDSNHASSMKFQMFQMIQNSRADSFESPCFWSAGSTILLLKAYNFVLSSLVIIF